MKLLWSSWLIFWAVGLVGGLPRFWLMGLSWSPSPFVLMKCPLFCFPILSWSMPICLFSVGNVGLSWSPSPFVLMKGPLFCFSHLKLGHAHLFVFSWRYGLEVKPKSKQDDEKPHVYLPTLGWAMPISSPYPLQVSPLACFQFT